MKKFARKAGKSVRAVKKSVGGKARKAFSLGLRSSRRKNDALGITRDGVVILRPKAKSKHFTSPQIRRAIIEVENAAG
jgi:hypothetical protein